MFYTVPQELEDCYQRYQNLREVAMSVYAKKIREYDDPDFERLCNCIMFSFDDNKQKKIAAQLGVSHQKLLQDMVRLSTGARLFNQGQ